MCKLADEKAIEFPTPCRVTEKQYIILFGLEQASFPFFRECLGERPEQAFPLPPCVFSITLGIVKVLHEWSRREIQQ